MSVLCEALSVVVPKHRLVSAFPGGVRGYRERVPNGTYCQDTHLTRVGFMAPDDVGNWIDRLATWSQLVPNVGVRWVDVAVVDQFTGPTAPCDWLEFARDREISRAWRRGYQPGKLATPVGWKPTAMRFHPNDEAEGLAFLPSATGGLETTIDPQTGEVSYISRGVVARAVVQEAWAQYLIDDVEVPRESRESLVCIMSARHEAIPIAALTSGLPPAEAIAELTLDVKRGTSTSRLAALGLPLGVGLSSYGPLTMTMILESGGERYVRMDGHYVLAAHPGQDPFVIVRPRVGDQLMTSRRLPAGTESLYAALEDLLSAFAPQKD